MYAIVKVGGKQYRVSQGDEFKVEKQSAQVGESVELDQVLSVKTGDGELLIGHPTLESAKVVTTVREHGRGDKVRIFKMGRRKHFQKRQGHRQAYTALVVESITH